LIPVTVLMRSRIAIPQAFAERHSMKESMTTPIERAVSALHTAHLDPTTGMGVLVLPSPANDVWLSGSLNGSDWDSAMRALASLGWEPSLDDDGAWIEEGQTRQGCPVVALVAAESVVSLPTLSELDEARSALLRACDAA
jgi:hypothetical protein